MIRKYVTLIESPYYPKKYTLTMDLSKLPIEYLNGSVTVLIARFLEISYPNFIRLCRDEFDATIVGKNKYYPAIYFTRSNKTDALLKLINTRIEWFVRRYENPYEIRQEGKEIIKEYYDGHIESTSDIKNNE